MDALQQYYSNLTGAEKSALVNFQTGLNEAGEVRTPIQTAEIVSKAFAQIHFDDYLCCEHLSSGKLKSCKTPLHLRREMENPTKTTKALITGSAVHSLILEPEKFEYVLFDDSVICAELIEQGYKSPRATSAYKEWNKQYQDDAGDRLPNVLDKDVFHSMWKLKKLLMKDQIVKNLFTNSQNEVSFFLELKEHVQHTGENLRLRIRPDGLKVADKTDARNFAAFGVNEGDMIIISVKSTLDASKDGFYRQSRKMQYDLSEAFYQDVLSRFYETKIHTVILTLEKDGNVFTGHYLLRYCSEEYINSGREAYNRNLNLYINSKDLSEGYQFMNNSIMEI